MKDIGVENLIAHKAKRVGKRQVCDVLIETVQMKDIGVENFIAHKAKRLGKRQVCDVLIETEKIQPLVCAAHLLSFHEHCEEEYIQMNGSSARHFISQKGKHVDKSQVLDVLIRTETSQSLLCAASLSIPSFQVVVMSANMGCNSCRDKVYKLLSKMTGFEEFSVDVRRKEVIVKGDFRFLRSLKEEA